MLPVDTPQDELRGGRPVWAIRPERAAWSPPADDRRTDVIVVGAGITGSLVAQHLMARGFDVCVLDRERPGFGSTMASTAMLLWEIDTPIVQLAGYYGFDKAAAVYRRSLDAVAGLKELIGTLRIDCAFRPRHSVYLAAGEIGAGALLGEHRARGTAGLPGDYLDHQALLSEFGLDRAAAIVSPGSAEADPAALAHGLLARARADGAHLFDDEAVTFDCAGRSVGVTLASGRVIEARHVVLATGYAMPDFITSNLHETTASWAVATPPQASAALWRDGALIWEASDSYAYLRTTADNRIVIGGEDESVLDPEARDRLMPAKQETLLGLLERLWPHAVASADMVWSGAFGTTADGLPLIGPVPGHPGILAAYGYGGNGITFSYMASRMLTEMIRDKRAAWHDDFALDRA